MARHDLATAPASDQQVEHEIAAAQGPVDAYQNIVLAQQASDTVVVVVEEVFGATPDEIAATRAAQAADHQYVPRGRYVFTPAQIEDQLRTCTDLIRGLTYDDLPRARNIVAVTPPAPDTVASVPNAQAISALGQRLVQRIENQIAFIENWRQQLRAVRQNYLDQDGNTAETWTALSGGLYT